MRRPMSTPIGSWARSWATLVVCVVVLALAPGASGAGPEGGLDSRGWEMVSPAEKNGGEVGLPGGEGAGAFQAAASGAAFAFASAASFGEAEGAAPQSQYLARREPGSWNTANVTPPLLSGTYAGGAYQLFSADLDRAILTSGWRCRDGGSPCAGENPPLAPGAPAGYRNLYLREGGAYEPLLSTTNASALTVSPEDFELVLEGADPDLRHVVFSTCAALTGDAVEVPDLLAGCDPASPNLYAWSDGTLRPVNLLPGQVESAPGAALAASAGAISSDGQRVYWSGADGNLYLRDGAETLRVDTSVGGGGEFQTASADGSIAFFTKAGHLYRYDAGAEQATDLTPGGEVQGVLGASADGSHLYYLAAAGLYLWREGPGAAGTTAKIAAGADASNYPPATGTARVTPDGTRLAFLSSASLTGYANVGKSEVFLYEAPAKRLLCASCNPKGSTPFGPSTIPAALAAGDGPAAYKPRALSADGSRLFFDSADSLVSTDTDHAADVYQWEANGTGGCTKVAGCVGLISSGRISSATFLDASADGTDAFFLTAASLLPADSGSIDVYDARAGGGFPEPPTPIPCLGDACQGPAPGPDDPPPATTLVLGRGNPVAPKAHRKKHHRKKQRRGKHGGRR